MSATLGGVKDYLLTGAHDHTAVQKLRVYVGRTPIAVLRIQP